MFAETKRCLLQGELAIEICHKQTLWLKYPQRIVCLKRCLPNLRGIESFPIRFPPAGT
jgi:hypothetical protein